MRADGRPLPGLPPIPLLALYTVLAVAPLGLAAWAWPREDAFARELALAAGLAAYALLLLQFVSSGRFEILSGKAGIDVTMRFHQLAARTVLALVLLHPLLFAAPAAMRDPVAALYRLARMLVAPHLASGVAALVLVLAVAVLGMLRRRLPLPYELWRASHLLGAVAAAGLGMHHVVTLGFYSGEGLLLGFWYALLALAFGSVGWVYLVRPALLWRRSYRLRSVRRVGDGLWELVLGPARGRAVGFRAGQFAWANFARLPVPLLDHPFSISSPPSWLPEIRLLILEQGDFTNRIGGIPPGTRVYLDAPHGHLALAGQPADAFVLVAGGVGLAPILGILRELHATGDRRPVRLIQAARTPGRLAFRDEIASMARSLDLRVVEVVGSPPPGWAGRAGNVDADAVGAAMEGLDSGRTRCFLCGPTAMMLDVAGLLRRAGVPARRIVYERFEYGGPGSVLDGGGVASLFLTLAVLAAVLAFALR